MLFSCCKYVILERPSWKLPSALSENCVSIFIYFCINNCFCIKQANKICTLLNSHLLALIVFSGTELQRLDREARKIVVENGGKHPSGSTPILYMPREKGVKVCYRLRRSTK